MAVRYSSMSPIRSARGPPLQANHGRFAAVPRMVIQTVQRSNSSMTFPGNDVSLERLPVLIFGTEILIIDKRPNGARS